MDTGGRKPEVSVIIPIRNEGEQIKECLESLRVQTYLKEGMEILLVDGMSVDDTRGRINEFLASTDGQIPSVRILENPVGQRAAGLNIGIRAARGNVIARVDARTVVPRDYIEKCVWALTETGADNVGGVQRPIAKTITQEAIGIALSHPFGVANARFRLGKKSGFVDTVYLGCFRREVFEKVGLFDEDASVISEDSDMNQRIREAGGKVYLDSDIEAFYYPRETLKDFWRLYFRYGGARAGNFLKHRRLTSWRQAAPVFVLVLAILGVLSFVNSVFLALLLALTSLYVAVDAVISMRLAIGRRKLGLFRTLLLAFPCIHFGYGLGFWKRLLIPDRTGIYWRD